MKILFMAGVMLGCAQPASDSSSGNGGANQVGGVETSTSSSFYWDMEELEANIYSGSGEPVHMGASELTREIAAFGRGSLHLRKEAFALAEFITDDQRTEPYEANPDFDFDLGSLEVYFYYESEEDWVRGAQILSMKNELDDTSLIMLFMGWPGNIHINLHQTVSSPTMIAKVEPGEWHRLLWKWRRRGREVDLFLQIDDNEPLEYTDSSSISQELSDKLDQSVETQILLGNDTARLPEFYLDELRIWKVWLD